MPQLPIAAFLKERLLEFDPTFPVRSGTGFERLFFKPMQFIVQPLRDEADDLRTAQSFRRILLTDDPDAFDEESVDALAENLFVDRVTGSTSGGTARVYYNAAVNREFPTSGAVFTGSNGKSYANTEPFSITIGQMGSQVENNLFYLDIPVQSLDAGADTDLEAGGLVELLDDDKTVDVTNSIAFTGGTDKETNTELIERTKASIAVRDLVTGKGFNAILFENFASTIQELQAIGFNDEEMMRDIQFNVHIGGKVDGYVKTPNILTSTQNFVGLLLDTTRQSFTSTNVTLNGTAFTALGNPNIDRSNGLVPIVTELKASSAATYLSTVDLSTTVDLSSDERIKMSIDGTTLEFSLAGSAPAATTRTEIIALINGFFGEDVAFASGVSIRIISPTTGLLSEVILDDPDAGTSALLEVFGLTEGGGPYIFEGDGPIEFIESVHYAADDAAGEIQRIIGAIVGGISSLASGESTASSSTFTDNTPTIFSAVTENDILTIESGPDVGDYRILEVTDDNNVVIDAELTTTAGAVVYSIRRTGIKDGELVFVEYYFNPLAIDVGKYIKLDEDGITRGVRVGRESQTIQDVAFLRINSIEQIDPVTEEGLGIFLDGAGGYGQGGYGSGVYGVGDRADYRLVVNEPSDRFSAFEDSYIRINSALQGLSFKVTYEYVPEVEIYHDFVRLETERVLDGDILMKHYIPAYVSGTINYTVDETDTTIPDNETLTAAVKEFISEQSSGSTLDLSDIQQFIVRTTDPFDRFGTSVAPFSLTAKFHNTDGSTLIISGDDQLVVPEEDPFPKDTDRPLTSRISHWIGDEIVMVRG